MKIREAKIQAVERVSGLDDRALSILYVDTLEDGYSFEYCKNSQLITLYRNTGREVLPAIPEREVVEVFYRGEKI